MASVPFTFLGYMRPADGYGYAATKIAKALRALTLPRANIIDMADDGRIPAEPLHYSVKGTAVTLSIPPLWNITADRLLGYTMFEATRPPASFIQNINAKADTLLVPTPWGKTIFQESGVTIPIESVPFGIDPDDYYPLERTHNAERPYIFFWSGTPDLRKGWDLAYKAFRLAFGSRSDVALLLHFRKTVPAGVRFNDANVDAFTGIFSLEELRGFYQWVDCMVFPSRGEGWGLPPREAAATGLPVIATNWGGLAYELPQWGIPLSVKQLRLAAHGYWQEGETGEWAEPDIDHLVHLMRDCVENRDAVTAGGAQAARWLAKNATWERTARGLMVTTALSEEETSLC
ncbi:MAG: glycosyltransferase [Anaerolineales bacterium]|nr:glycosyltransferase [Anaerolineales bacterium]